VLYRVVAEHLATFLARADADPWRTLPRFVRRELSGYLDCGIAARGFALVKCGQCGKADLVAFSCKGRGFCPSCGGRRMADTAAWLVDRVLPEVPVRQWVLSLPARVRWLCAYDPDACAEVRRVFVRAVLGLLRRRAKAQGIVDGRSGAVVAIQRFDSALRLYVHLHALFVDGVFARNADGTRTFHEAPPLRDEDVAKVAQRIRNRVLRRLRELGKLSHADEAADESTEASEPWLAKCYAAAVEGRVAFGESAGARVLRLRDEGEETLDFRQGELCVDVEGFSLHAKVRVSACARTRLEKLCRYVLRPAVAQERLSLLPDGRVLYQLKKRYRDGSTHVVLPPLVFLERLAALVPRPRRHLITYHGVLAPAAAARPAVVPDIDPEATAGTSATLACPAHPRSTDHTGGDAEPPLTPSAKAPAPASHRASRPRRRYSWADLMARVFGTDVLLCGACGGRRRVLEFIVEPLAIRRILRHLALPEDPPSAAPARAPPATLLPWSDEGV
jgi:hypothetical protein